MTESIYGDFVAFLRTHHKGKRKAVTSRRLEAFFTIKGSEVRKIVNEARSSGHSVCSDNCGYYYVANEKEINATIAKQSGRIRNISSARDGLVSALGKS